MSYDAGQLQSILRAAGWPESLLVTQAAIGLAESRGNPNAYNGVSPDNSYGLWQINMIGSLGPARRAALGINSNSALFDPVTNARAALMVYNQQGFRAWSVYLNGSYRSFLSASQAAYNAMANQVPASPVIPSIETPIGINPVIPFPREVNIDSGLEAGNIGTAALIIGAGILTIYLIAK